MHGGNFSTQLFDFSDRLLGSLNADCLDCFRGAFLRKAAPWGLARESCSSRLGSVTTTKLHEFFPIEVGARSKASTSKSMVSTPTALSWYLRILLRFRMSGKNI